MLGNNTRSWCEKNFRQQALLLPPGHYLLHSTSFKKKVRSEKFILKTKFLYLGYILQSNKVKNKTVFNKITVGK